jgi:hypothetical protein
VDGTAVDGVAVDGVAVDGTAVDGVAVEGVEVDGVAVVGLSVVGLSVVGLGVVGDWLGVGVLQCASAIHSCVPSHANTRNPLRGAPSEGATATTVTPPYRRIS